eukprot:Em0015g598a
MHVYVAVYISDCLGISKVGFFLILFAVSSAAVSSVCGTIVKYVPECLVLLLAGLIDIGLIIFLLVWKREPSYAAVIIFVIGWGVADAIWEVMYSGFVAYLFPLDTTAAFGAASVWQGLGLTIHRMKVAVCDFSDFTDPWEKASDFFQPLQFGVSCTLGSEKVIHGLWRCQLSSEAGVQQGDPLGPLFFALVLHKVVSAIDADDECLDLLFQAWFLDDGVLAGAPIGDYLFCANFIASKRLDAVKLLSKLVEVATIDPQILGKLTRPADVLVADWERGRPAALDVTVASLLTPAVLNEAGMTAGAAAAASEQRKHIANDPKCQELGWVCVPLAVETYGN